MMRTLLALLLACMLYAAAAPQRPPTPAPMSTATPESRLIDDIGSHAELMPNLERLCDDIGARLTGSPGEEQGLLGSRAYKAAHRGELDRIQAVLVQDTGSGRVTGFPDMRNDAW
ncbi:hypothetical protein [Herbaspirillum sp. SJZ107]|uniref:hypothetical protein n=1 Tax=Herbaspirillum sp. SJZ107 TaxID=2572881 RepID=UPI00114F7228|nr:hypothetical protein [Herbaspirillum sp. SJZ107]